MNSPNQTILFQGDSITDARRARDVADANSIHGLGNGYCFVTASSLLSERPNDGLKFYNRGVSGNRVTDLLARWRPDAIHLRPDLISILIGVNDTWHHFGSDNGTSPEIYETAYRLILESTRKELPATKLVLCEPFALPSENAAFKPEWCADLAARSELARGLAAEFDAAWVPFQGLFDQLALEAPAAYWLPDGVHPSPAGHCRMAAFWRKHAGFQAG